MDNGPVNSSLQKIEENARKELSSSPKGNEANRSHRKNCTPVKIKEETTDEIQEYAATTMSELLGWYGYDKVDTGCTRSLNLDHFTSRPTTENTQILVQMEKDIASSKLSSSSTTSVNPSNSLFEVSSIPLSYSTNNLISMNRRLVLPPIPLKKVSLNSTSKYQYENYSNTTCLDKMSCSWCGRITHICESEKSSSFSFNMVNPSRHFCSEACFVAGRRASFKRAKTCHWCKHLRNPTSCFDFQDEESQLQFCSDQCLNQYKMHIFCHETQTHLMLQGINNVSFHDAEGGDGLITPELWLRSCQSPLNSSKEDTYLVEKHLTSNLQSPLGDNEAAKRDKKYFKKTVEPSRKVSRKKTSLCIRKYTKTSNCSEKKNCYTEKNEGHATESIEKQTLGKKESKFCHFVNKQTHCSVNCTEENDLSCKNFKEECAAMDTTLYHNSDSNQNSKKFLERNIHARHIRNLLHEEHHNFSEDMVHSSPWIDTLDTSVMHPGIPFLSKSCAIEPDQMKHHKQTDISSGISPSMENGQTESFYSSSATTLPPVTVLVPYPIPLPIPIPIPIPIPVPSTILDKLKNDNDKHDLVNTKDLSSKNSESTNSVENTCCVSGSSQNNTTNAQKTEGLQCARSNKFCLSSSSPSTIEKKIDNVQRSKQHTRALRKRKNLNDPVATALKRLS